MDKLGEFLISIGDDSNKLKEFIDNPSAAMDAAGLSKAEKAIVRSGDPFLINQAVFGELPVNLLTNQSRFSLHGASWNRLAVPEAAWNRLATPDAAAWNRLATPDAAAWNRLATPDAAAWNRLATPDAAAWNRVSVPQNDTNNNENAEWNRLSTPPAP